MAEQVNNIGQIAAIWVAAIAPDNKKLIWYDTSSEVHRVYDESTGDWKPLNPQIITDVSISTLRTIATTDGLPIGKFYNLIDTGTLAIAITTTKIWYVDAHGNYVVDDLASSTQHYLNSSNLYIDGTAGVWDVNSGQLRFSFTEVSNASTLNSNNDYIVMRHNNNGVWSWIKSKISAFISSVAGNAISWNNGFYFNFQSAVSSITNVQGGVVGHDTYEADKIGLDTRFNGISSQITSAVSTAKHYTDTKVSDYEIFNKQLPSALNIPTAPPNAPSVNTKLVVILSQIYGWINKLKVASNIYLTQGLNPNGIEGNVNANDSISNAISKLIWKTKHVIRIDENAWHTGSGLRWIIRGDTLFLRLSGGNYLTSFINNRCYIISVDLGDDILQYIDTIFANIPWMYNTASTSQNRLKQKWVYLCDVQCTSFSATDGNGNSYSGVPINTFLSLYLCINQRSNDETGEITSRSCTLGTAPKDANILYNSAAAGQTPVLNSVAISTLSTSNITVHIPSDVILTLPLSF